MTHLEDQAELPGTPRKIFGILDGDRDRFPGICCARHTILGIINLQD